MGNGDNKNTEAKGEETKTEETKTEATGPKADQTRTEQAGDLIETDVVEEEPGALFADEEAQSVDELTGIDDEKRPPEEETKPEETPTEDKAASSEPKGGEGKPPEEKKPEETETKAEEKETKEPGLKPDDTKPPPGFVSKKALDEERNKRQDRDERLRERDTEIADLNRRISDLEAGRTEDREEAGEKFEVLSDEAYEKLVREDPQEAMLYDRKLRRHEDKLRRQEQEQAKQDQERDALEAKAREDTVQIETSFKRMAENVPGLFDESQPVSGELTKFAQESGLSDDLIVSLSHPGTLLLSPDGEDPILLGDGAAEFVEALFKLKTASAEADPAKIRESLIPELTKEITAKVTKDLIAKFKEGSPGADIRSLGDLPGAGTEEDEIDFTKDVSEADYHKMTPAQRKKALGG